MCGQASAGQGCGSLTTHSFSTHLQGRQGQAVIRGEKNAIGLSTKKFPSHNASAYYR